MLNLFVQQQHAMLPRPSHDEAARQAFARATKSFIQAALLPALGPIFEKRAAPAFAREERRPPADRHDIRRAMLPDPGFQLYASTNRVAQEMIWDTVIDTVERQRDALAERAAQLSDQSPADLVIRQGFDVPRYVQAIDIHCMPGGYAGDRAGARGDVAAGALYDRGVFLYAMGYMGPLNDDMGRSVARWLRRARPELAPRSILDMGCTCGHSTVPWKELYPQAEVTGIDVAEPQLRYAHARAAALGHAVHFVQADASDTGFPDGSFDLVVSHILLHETSGKAMPAIFREAYRLLAPGGLMIHADLPPFDKFDPFAQFILDNETWFNNEPFWGAMRELDQLALAKSAGFAEARFDTAPMVAMAGGAAGSDGPPEPPAERQAGEYAPGGGWEILVAERGHS